jgi:hypothetical protein
MRAAVQRQRGGDVESLELLATADRNILFFVLNIGLGYFRVCNTEVNS